MHARDYQASAQRLIVHNKRMAAGARRRSNDRQNCNDGANRRIENGRISSASDFVFVCILRSARHTCRHFDALFKFSGHFCVFFQRFSSFIPAPTLPSAPLPVCLSVCPSIHRSVDPCRCGCMMARMSWSRSCRGTPPSPRRAGCTPTYRAPRSAARPRCARSRALVHAHTLTHTHMHTRAHTRTNPRPHTHVHMRTRTHAHASTRAHAHARRCVRAHARTACVPARGLMHTRALTHTRTAPRLRGAGRKHTRTHTHTHTHSAAPACTLQRAHARALG